MLVADPFLRAPKTANNSAHAVFWPLPSIRLIQALPMANNSATTELFVNSAKAAWELSTWPSSLAQFAAK